MKLPGMIHLSLHVVAMLPTLLVLRFQRAMFLAQRLPLRCKVVHVGGVEGHDEILDRMPPCDPSRAGVACAFVRARLIVTVIAAPLLAASTSRSTSPAVARVHEDRIRVGSASLYVREVGRGRPIIVLHGGPDFDLGYLLPDLDRLADRYHLIYYDQRGRGRSADNVLATDVSLTSDLADLEQVQQHVGFDSTAVLGHSWGAVLALEYALRHPQRVSQLVLMNPAPVSTRDLALFRAAYLKSLGADMDRQRQIVATDAYKRADPETVAARYRIHFEHALQRPQDYEKLMATMKAGFIRQGPDGILKARAAEDALMRDTWDVDGYDLLPKLHDLAIPTLVLTGEHDFIPTDVAAHIAQAMPHARLATLKDCGHFAFLERPDDVRRALDGFFRP